MTTERPSFTVRRAVPADVSALNRMLGAIIAIGGTTAYQTALTDAEFDESFVGGPRCVACFVADSDEGEDLLGFQAISRNEALPGNWVDIATYARPLPKVPGVGTALFLRTRAAAQALGLDAINATIRADNRCGLPYYEKMGFRTYDVMEGVPLDDGTPVNRIKKRFLLASSDPSADHTPSRSINLP